MTPDANVVATEWRRIEQWLRAHAPSWLDEQGRHPLFNRPASESDLAEIESKIAQPLPEEHRSLLRIHDGCRYGGYPLPAKPTHPTKWRLAPMAEIVERRTLCATVAKLATAVTVKTVGNVSAVWWSTAWIPIAEDGTGDLVCIDTSPPVGGTSNQLILYEHDNEERKVLYPSLSHWLRECADGFDRGDYVFVAGLGIYPKDEAPRD